MSGNVLTEQEKARVRYHTGYPSMQAVPSLQFGIPQPLQTSFLMENALTLLNETAVPRVRDILQILDNLEQQMVDAQAYLVADQLEELHLAGSQNQQTGLVTDRLENEYRRWAGRLADIFGVPLYPFSKRFASGAGQRAGNIPVRNG